MERKSNSSEIKCIDNDICTMNTHVMLSICWCIFYLDTGTSRNMCPCTQKIQNVMIGIINLLNNKDYR